MEEVRVGLGDRSYTIAIGEGILDDLGGHPLFRTFSRVAVVSNPTVFGLYGGRLVTALEKYGIDASIVTIPDGEEYKDLLWAYYIHGQLLNQGLDRKSCLIALGGGVIGDITGFVASTYMRGISFVQVPTTLLAQVDSSVGGKTGVNHPLGKNMIGTFYQPRLVWTDVGTLRTLPDREFRAGMAEVIKCGVIRDEHLFAFIEANSEQILAMESSALAQIIRRSCEIKAAVVSEDEREDGVRAILNYGHTVGHAVESATGYTRYLHGEAVGMGMCLEARLSALLGFLGDGEVARISSLITACGLPSTIPPGLERDRIVSAMRFDKKAVKGEFTFVLPEHVGRVRIERVTDTGKIGQAIKA